jgi:hypothetical protein
MNLYRLSELNFVAPYFSAIDCILNGDRKRAVYCSTELSSGFRLYEAMREHKAHTLDELEKLDRKIYKDVKKANEQAAKDFATKVRAKQTDRTLVINPAPLSISEWGQPEYLAFWDELIRTRVKEIRFNENWQYSNGCTYEFTVALDEGGIVMLGPDGNTLGPDKAIADVRAVVQWLEDEGFSEAYEKLRKNLERLQQVWQAKQQVITTLSGLQVPETISAKVLK